VPFKRREGEYVVEAHDGTTWELLRDRAAAIDAAVTTAGSGLGQQINLAVGDEAASVRQARVSAGYFRVLGVAPLVGREFTREEDQPGGAAVAVLSYALWQRLFNGDASALGKTLLLRGEPHEIIGVMPRELRGETGDFDVWTPVRPTPDGEGQGTNYGVIARVKPGYTWAQALAAMPALDGNTSNVSWAATGPTRSRAVVSRSCRCSKRLTAGAAKPLVTLFGAVCRGAARRVREPRCASTRAREQPREGDRTRLALGSRTRRRRAAALRRKPGARRCRRCVRSTPERRLSRSAQKLARGPFTEWAAVTLDLRAFAVTAAVAVAASVLFGLFPALCRDGRQRQRIAEARRRALAAFAARAIGHGARSWPLRSRLAPCC
jgi:hypothetical protein